MPVYPISFSIPEEHVVPQVPSKTRAIAYISPHDRSTYIYKDQRSYYKGYQESWFGSTIQKAGWDCLRHYEILANGCIPYFENLQNCPPNVMRNFPKSLVAQAMRFDPHLPRNHAVLTSIIEQLLQYTRQHLTTRATATYLLQTIRATATSKILMLNGINIKPDYLRCLTAHGLRQVLGTNFIEAPRLPHLYTDYPEEQLPNLYGQGFTYSRLLDAEADKLVNRQNIEARIKAKEFDFIIYGSMHRGQPFWPLIKSIYPATRIVFLCGEDTHVCPFMDPALPYHVFVRELDENYRYVPKKSVVKNMLM